jgi:hypothetical protein
MTRVLIASRAANTLGSSTTGGRRPAAQTPMPARPGMTRRILAALAARRRGRAVEAPASGRPARELARAER